MAAGAAAVRASFLDIKGSPRLSVRTGGSATASPGAAGGLRGEWESLGGRSGWSAVRAPEVSELSAALPILGGGGLRKPSDSASGSAGTVSSSSPRARAQVARAGWLIVRAELVPSLYTGAEARLPAETPGALPRKK